MMPEIIRVTTWDVYRKSRARISMARPAARDSSWAQPLLEKPSTTPAEATPVTAQPPTRPSSSSWPRRAWSVMSW